MSAMMNGEYEISTRRRKLNVIARIQCYVKGKDVPAGRTVQHVSAAAASGIYVYVQNMCRRHRKCPRLSRADNQD